MAIADELAAVLRRADATADALRAERDAYLQQRDDALAKLDAAIAERDEIRAEFDAHLAQPHWPAPVEPEPTPKRRFLVGAAMYDNGDPSPLEDIAGVRFGVRRTFWDSSTSKTNRAVEIATDDVAKGRVPILSFKVGAHGSWAQVAAGSADNWARNLAGRLSALGGRVMVAVHHEPEGDGPMPDWTAMQRRLAPIFAVPGVEYGVIYTGWHEFYAGPQFALANTFPTGAPIRWAGFDVYQKYGTVKGGRKVTGWTDMDSEYFEPIEAFLAPLGIPWGLTETGLTDAAQAEHPNGPTFIADCIAAMKGRGAEFYAYFNTDQNSIGTWPLGTGPKRDQFIEALRAHA